MSYRGEQTVKGKTYVYEATASWNPDKKRSEQKRVYIGSKDPVTGDFVPNKKYYELYGGAPETQVSTKELAVNSVHDFGNAYLLDQIGTVIGVTEALKKVFPTAYQELLACAWYSIMENKALYLCDQWADTTAFVSGLKLSSQRISELLVTLDESSRMAFYREWASQRLEKEYLALDITSISSYSELIEVVEYGYNRDKEALPQLNLAMLFGEESGLPIFCRAYPGSIKDVSTLSGMVRFMSELKLSRMHYVMDKGFYSEAGIRDLLTTRIKFVVVVPFTTKLAKDAVANCLADMTNPTNALELNGQLFYGKTTRLTLADRRAYCHVYFDETRHTAERTVFMQKLLKQETALLTGKLKPTDNFAKKYFSCRQSKNGLIVRRNEAVIQKELALAGYFVILTNDSKDASYSLSVYRTKDVVKSRLTTSRTT